MGSTRTAADNAPAKELTGAAKNQGDHKDVSIIFPPTFLCGESNHLLVRAGVSVAYQSLPHMFVLLFLQERLSTSSRIQVRQGRLTAKASQIMFVSGPVFNDT